MSRLSLLGGMVFLLAFGTAYADDTTQLNYDKVDKMMQDQNLQKNNQDQNQGTVNQMPAPKVKGSGAGGSGEPALKDNTSESPAPLKNMTDPYDSSGHGKKDPYKDMEKYEGDTYRY